MENVEDVLMGMITLAVMTCACDGEIHSDENSILQEWIDAKPEKYRLMLRKTMQDALRQLEEKKGIPIKQVCKKLVDNAHVSDKYDALELCLRIVQVDGVGADDEMRFLMSVGRWLGLDYGKFREMRDKIIPVELYDSVDIDFLIGIHLEMTIDEKLKHLTKEYKRWNELTTHSNAKKREQAKQMIEFIANRRGELREEKRRDHA